MNIKQTLINVAVTIAAAAAFALVLHGTAHADSGLHASPSSESWTGTDKRIHFAVSFVAGVAAANALPNEPVKAFGYAMIPGTIKEVLDASGSGFSYKDMAADALGAALGVAGTHWLIKRANGTTVVAYHTAF